MKRQGDVLIVPADSKPDNVPTPRSPTGMTTVAYGEVTGHHHSTSLGAATLFRPDDAGIGGWLDVGAPGGAEVTHQEHDTVLLTAGLYFMPTQMNETSREATRVED